MTEERELCRAQTGLVEGALKGKIGQAILTTHRLVFVDQKFAANAGIGGVAGALLTGALQKRHEEGGPYVDVALDTVLGASRETKLFGQDRIRVRTSDGEYLFGQGWKAWGGLLRRALEAEHGRRIVDDGPDAWRVTRPEAATPATPPGSSARRRG
jgi:hypothetical protein